MKGMLKLGIVLAFYVAVACVGLAFIYGATKDTIAIQAQEALDRALMELFPDADTFKELTGTITSADPKISFEGEYAAQKGNTVLGVAIQASGPSYGGPVKVLVGVGTDGTITRVKILEHKDTPGLGANAASPTYYVDKANKVTFYGQFTGKSITESFMAKQDIAAITASTITSQAVATVVKGAGEAASAWLAAQTGGAK